MLMTATPSKRISFVSKIALVPAQVQQFLKILPKLIHVYENMM